MAVTNNYFRKIRYHLSRGTENKCHIVVEYNGIEKYGGGGAKGRLSTEPFEQNVDTVSVYIPVRYIF